MKTKLTRAAGLLLLLLTNQFLFASFGGGSIMGQVVDPDTKKPVADATVVLDNKGTTKEYTTNENGYYYASNIPAGVYNITVSFMSKHTDTYQVELSSDEQRTFDVELSNAIQMNKVVVYGKATRVEDKLINPVEPITIILKGEEMKKTASITKISDAAETLSGVVKVGNDYYIHGARAGGLAYYIDGGKVMGSPDIPLCGLQTYRMYDAYIPAKYGDALGGVVVIETRNYFSQQH